MKRSVVERAANAGQLCWRGRNHGRMLMLGEAHEEYRFKVILSLEMLVVLAATVIRIAPRRKAPARQAVSAEVE